jgi:hypothetical protein
MTSLTPEQLAVLQRIVQDTTLRVEAVLGIPSGTMAAFLDKLQDLVRYSCGPAKGRRYGLILNNRSHGAAALEVPVLLRHILTGKAMIVIDQDLRVISADQCTPSIGTLSERTDADRTFGVLVEGTYLHYFLCGKCIGETDCATPGTSRPAVTRWRRPIAEFRTILSEHKAACIDSEKHVRYWYDRKKRILLTGPDGTEMLFHSDLFWWLNNFVDDALDVYADPRGSGQDRTDIIVVTQSGNHVIEVKWMGRNEKKTEYDGTRINEGLVQVDLYLKSNETLVRGHLVVYDGRCPVMHACASQFTDGLKNARCDTPHVLFLPSATPSVAAPAIAAGGGG